MFVMLRHETHCWLKLTQLKSDEWKREALVPSDRNPRSDVFSMTNAQLWHFIFCILLRILQSQGQCQCQCQHTYSILLSYFSATWLIFVSLLAMLKTHHETLSFITSKYPDHLVSDRSKRVGNGGASIDLARRQREQSCNYLSFH